jgi:uncharacterized protein
MTERIQHAYAERVFRIALPEGAAELRYHRQGATLVFASTWVPPQLRGKGIAEELCEAAFRYAEAQGASVIPACSYIAENFLRKRPEWMRIVARR